MANITHYNVSDVALYYQGLVALAASPLPSGVASEEIRKRAVTYTERRRAMFSLPSRTGQLDTLGDKILFDLRQMGLAAVADANVQLTRTGLEIAGKLRNGNGRCARLAILARLIETYENAAYFCATITPPSGKPLAVPIPRSTTEETDDDEGEPRLMPANLKSVCTAWIEWCRENRRPDLIPSEFQQRAEALIEASRDKRGFAEKARNALAQLVVDSATKGRIAKPPIYRTVRDRLSTAGAINSITRPVQGKPLSVELVFSCMHVGQPSVLAEEWQRLGAPRPSGEELWIHEAEPEKLEASVLAALKTARLTLVERAGYYRIYELRDRVCETLSLSQGMFDSVFVYIYRTRPGLMTLGVDYEKITAKRLPVEIRDGASSNLFNLVAFKD